MCIPNSGISAIKLSFVPTECLIGKCIVLEQIFSFVANINDKIYIHGKKIKYYVAGQLFSARFNYYAYTHP